MELDYLNYKQPLKAVEDGYGYLGTLAQTKDGELVQCHVCGELVANLGHHAWMKHNIKAKEYRQQFQLGRTTPLCSDAWSQKYKQMKVEMWNNMTEEEREARRNLMREAQTKTKRIGNPRSLEALNKDGMCPDQLLEKIQMLANKLGHTPAHSNFKKEYDGKYIGAIQRTFGSWNSAVTLAGFTPCQPGTKKGTYKTPYTNEQLLQFLSSFYKEKGYVPTHADWVRGLLPNYNVYRHRFGSIAKARQLAGIPTPTSANNAQAGTV